MVDTKHRVRKSGKRIKNFSQCESCSDWWGRQFLKHVIGFFEEGGEWYCVLECPKCFDKFYFHLPSIITYTDWKIQKEVQDG